MKGAAAVIGALCLSPLLLVGTVSTAHSAAAASSADCATDTNIDTGAVARKVAAILDGNKSGKSIRVEGLDLPGEQIPNAKTIVATGFSLKVPERGQRVALATAMQESRLRNLPSGDRDSLGLFQQRPSQGWGSPQQLRDPVYASTKFYKALLSVDGWQQMTLAQAAQAVQKSAFPDAYAQWEKLTRALHTGVVKTLPNSGGANGAGSAPGGRASGPGCAPGEDGSGYGPIPEGTVPKGYTIPQDAPAKVRTAITWSMRQLGTPYQWGGSCTDAHGPDPMKRCDCSSLMQQAYAKAGIELTRTTYTQVNEGKPVSPKALKAGDLLFARGSAARPEHVGIALGRDLVLNAPRTGKPVRIEPIKDWDILAALRVTS
ncbi:C40 family peptidase [Streptomyces bathyalis]|uniref:C40 family peptidase n=1 Tax=Streptomyces bathyalis TaxID=2710756 RepID=A0A7T1WRY3_9ACTN|nr:C40 family peptidase [Streptomyces bathyalis]QPP05170.1 C40 family peptidase [Streptomyces bathyalis]